METADAVVIGGGVIGTSIAFRLAKLFTKVVLIEKKEIGGQTSASCDKAIFIQSKKPGFPIKLRSEERRVGKESRSRCAQYAKKQNNKITTERDSSRDRRYAMR